ncbi:hypothetical protein GMORB2_1437 [Geosmithia morbida]|uniref:Uncharacterized protein n=1 Tax=Geosmithia morbida TaxID=1094350 RepID=A0A9P4Z2E0_9HYPO|nr:uncharacterized protein GMORB2_1437 [Geosmithia morbida]KAF4126191.1 hypothetical protein GMORB2_1437 [Geosmithia morbida]
MVNHGVSRACRTYSGLSCNVCIRAGRICLGYESEGDLVFRHHRAARFDVLVSSPPRQLPVGDDYFVAHAVELFRREYCVRPAVAELSRGYLQGVSRLLRQEDGDAIRACKAMVLRSLGERQNRPGLIERAHDLYHGSIQSLRARVSDETFIQSPKALAVITLCGLYEISGQK